MNQIKVGNQEISDEGAPFFVSEIGINHNGSIETAQKLIDMAATAGADAVKFQKREPEVCVPEHKKQDMRETPWGKIPYIEYKKKIEFGKEEYRKIDKYCKEKDILWTASAWDEPSFEFLKKFDLPFHEIASAKLTDKSLLKKIRDTGKPAFLSTGGSTMKQVKKAVDVLADGNPLVIMQCNSAYPAKEEELNLNAITTLNKEFPDHIIGYSGHEENITPSIIAAAIEANVIERHITLDKSMWGSDQKASLEPEELEELIENLKKLPKWMGDGKKKVYDSEKQIMDKLRNKDTL